jgi:hypothetical protein
MPSFTDRPPEKSDDAIKIILQITVRNRAAEQTYPEGGFREQPRDAPRTLG